MMLDYAIFAVTFVLFLIVAVIYLYPGSQKLTTIPGPLPIDLLEGNKPDIAACGSLHEFLSKAHEQYGPIVSLWFGSKMAVSIASPELFKEQANCFNRPGDLFEFLLPLIGDASVQFANGKEGRRRHAAYSSCYNTTTNRLYWDILLKLSKQTVSHWRTLSTDEHIPVMEQMFSFAVRSILSATFGQNNIDETLVHDIHKAYDICMAECNRLIYNDQMSDDRQKVFDKNKQLLYEVVEKALNKARDSSDLVPFVEAITALELSKTAVISDILTVYIAGVHTSALLLTWALYYLADDQRIQDAVYSEIQSVFTDHSQTVTPDNLKEFIYLNQVIKETLRCSTLAPFAARVSDWDIELAGHKIPASTPIIQALGVVLQDPEIYEDPERFDPERFSAKKRIAAFAFEPFGFAGKRKCPGYLYSVAEATVLLVELVTNFQIKLIPDQVVMKDFGLVCRPKDEIWITVSPRN